MIDVGEHSGIQLNLGIAHARRCRQRVPAGQCQRARYIRIARHRHPRFAPDQIQHVLPRQRGARSDGIIVSPRVFGTQSFCAVRAIEYAGEQAIQRQVVERRERMGDDDVRHEAGEFIDRGLLVLVDIDDDVGRRQFAYAHEIDVFGAADFRNAAHAVARVNAKAGAADQRRREAEFAYELGDARHQRHNARRRCHRGVARACGIDKFVRRLILPWVWHRRKLAKRVRRL